MRRRRPESVWDYPRPPRIEPSTRLVRVLVEDVVIAATRRAVRVLETSHPPTWYVHPDDVRTHMLVPSAAPATLCEFKGAAVYFDVVTGTRRVRAAAWSYPDPTPTFRALRHWIAFYPGRVTACFLDDERVVPQDGEFYGGWISSDVSGPFADRAAMLQA